MADKWDCYLGSIKTDKVVSVDSWLKRRADAVRRDAFPESPSNPIEKADRGDAKNKR
jgi:hypothetical protein